MKKSKNQKNFIAKNYCVVYRIILSESNSKESPYVPHISCKPEIYSI